MGLLCVVVVEWIDLGASTSDIGLDGCVRSGGGGRWIYMPGDTLLIVTMITPRPCVIQGIIDMLSTCS